jgi:hypothetical protein
MLQKGKGREGKKKKITTATTTWVSPATNIIQSVCVCVCVGGGGASVWDDI